MLLNSLLFSRSAVTELKHDATLKAGKRDMFQWMKHIPLTEVVSYFSAKDYFSILLSFSFLSLLLSEDVFRREAFHGGYLFKYFHVEVLFVAKDGITIRLMGNVLTGEADNVLQGKLR